MAQSDPRAKAVKTLTRMYCTACNQTYKANNIADKNERRRMRHRSDVIAGGDNA